MLCLEGRSLGSKKMIFLARPDAIPNFRTAQKSRALVGVDLEGMIMAWAWTAPLLVLRIAALTAVYVTVAWLGLSFAFVHGTVSPVWPPTGLAIAALTLWGPRLWPGVALGAFIANHLIAGNVAGAAAAIALGNSLEAVVGAIALRRLGVKGEVSRVRDGVVMLVVAMLAPLPSATIGVSTLTIGGFSTWGQYTWVWLVWWLGNFMGALLVMPLTLAWAGEQSPVRFPDRPVEFAGALIVATGLVSFAYLRSDALAMLGVEFLPPSAFLFPPMAWAVLRLRPRETTMVVATASAVAVAYTVAFTEGETIGPLLWLQMVLLGVGGGSLLMVGAMAEHVEARQALHANEIRFRTIFEQAAVGIAQIGRDGRFLEVNRRLCDMLGYDRQELLGKTFEEVTAPTFLDQERRVLADLLAGRRSSYVIEKQYLRKDGSPVWVRTTSSLPDEAGSAYRISIVEDISKQQQAMADLAEAHAQLQFALKGAHAGMWEWDIPADRGRWTEENYDLTGLDRKAPLTFETWLSTVIPEDRERASETVKSILDHMDPNFTLEFRVRHPEKGLRWLLGIGQVIHADDGAPLRMSGLNIDITDLKRAEEEARAASRAKSTFLAAASHDLRQPVQALVLLNAVLANHMQGHPAEQVLEKMGKALDSLQRLLGALLDISRLDAGVVAPEVQAIPLASIFERLRAEYAMKAAERGLSLRMVAPGAWTRTDPTLLERILRNLIENSLRYTDRGKILVGCRRRGDTLCLQVIDTGIGIRREHQEAIFQEFYQVGNPERDREKGLGLGLSIVSRMSRLLGHRLTMVSEPGRGTCFIVELPAAKPEGGSQPEIASREKEEDRWAIWWSGLGSGCNGSGGARK